MIVVAYGAEISKITLEALEASDIMAYLDSGMDVAIKPNLVVPGPAGNGAVTHPEVVEGIIAFLKGHGVRSIKIIESSWVGDSTKRAFKYSGFEELAARHGVPLIDLKSDGFTVRRHGDYEIAICDEALRTDFLLNVPVLKAHCQTKLTCCMKNLKGCIPDKEKRRFHALGIHKPVAALNALLKTGYNVVDGICGDLSFEEGGNPVTSDRIIAGKNPLTVDSYCARLIGYSPDEIEYISYGRKIGVGEYFSPETEIVELGAGKKPARDTRAGGIAEKYGGSICEDAACSACYSALIYALHRLGGVPPDTGMIRIGQGFAGKKGAGFGVGNCARGFERHVPGCPPKATDIIEALGKQGPTRSR